MSAEQAEGIVREGESWVSELRAKTPQAAERNSSPPRRDFLTTAALDAVHGQIAHYKELPRTQSPGEPETGRILGIRQGGSTIYSVPVPSRGDFRTVGHYFFAIILGVLGGVLALRFSRHKLEETDER